VHTTVYIARSLHLVYSGRVHVRVHGGVPAVYTCIHVYAATSTGHVHERYTYTAMYTTVHTARIRPCTWSIQGHVHGPYTDVYGRVLGRVHVYSAVFTAVYTCTPPCTRTVLRSVYTAVYTCIRHRIRIRPGTRAVYMHGHAHGTCTYTAVCAAVITTRTRPCNGQGPCPWPCTGRVYLV